jgi:hypothetical protein
VTKFFPVLAALCLAAPAHSADPAGRAAELQRLILSKEALIDSLRESADKFNQIGRDCDEEARECLRDKPPRFSSAAAFQAQARAAYAEARKCDQEASAARRELAAARAELQRLGR